MAEIYRKEGGESTNAVIRADGIIATKNYLNFCLHHENFVAWNAGTERCDFLLLTKRWRKEWKEDWSLQTVVEMNSSLQDQQAPAAKATGTTPSTGNTSRALTPKAKGAKAKPKAKGQDMYAKASQIKSEVQNTILKYRNVMRTLPDEQRWEFSRKECSRLHEAMEEEVQKNSYISDWMAMTLAEFKKQSQITPEQFGDLSLFSDNFAKPLMQELEST